MKELLRIIWIMIIQCISCRLAGWAWSPTLFLLVVTLLWQGVFASVIYRISTPDKDTGKDISLFSCLLLSFPALFFPIMTMLIFSGFSVFRVSRISGIMIINKSVAQQFSEGVKFTCNMDLEYVEPQRSNPATSLPMCGAVDTSGNAYGSSINNYKHYS